MKTARLVFATTWPFFTCAPRLQTFNFVPRLPPRGHAIISTIHDDSSNYVFDSEFYRRRRPRGSLHRFIRKSARTKGRRRWGNLRLLVLAPRRRHRDCAKFHHAGIKGELDVVAYDGAVLAFVEMKTRAKAEVGQPTPEDAINMEKHRNLARMARQFLRARRLENTLWRFDVLAIEASIGQKPTVRLHKSAFSEHKR